MLIEEVTGPDFRKVITSAPRDTIADVVDLLKEYSIGAVVVTADGRAIVGIISERDVVRHLATEQEGTLRLRVEELMTQNVLTCSVGDDIETVMATMTSGHFRHMPVIAADGGLVGIVSLGDLVDARLTELEASLRDSAGD
ncbi:MAG: CBS domain-containing protein [Acidobacteria bacterium]|nr:CBS domain-containing protein [Acidobacteriota bacterium]